jgi:hypothetical protein
MKRTAQMPTATQNQTQHQHHHLPLLDGINDLRLGVGYTDKENLEYKKFWSLLSKFNTSFHQLKKTNRLDLGI